MVRLSTQVSARLSAHFVSYSFIQISTPNGSIFIGFLLIRGPRERGMRIASHQSLYLGL